MTAPGEEQAVSSGFVRSYVITGGRGLPDAEGLSLVTLVSIAPDRHMPPNPSPEVRAIWELCSGGYLSVAEVAGHLELPVAVTRLLLNDLAAQGNLIRRQAPPPAQLVDRKILEEVLHGLQVRFG
ncbi:DUF742 domain-containing protein [Streptomyces sp. NPDC052052]|uniref:DUF742 domain-containing protein n=1 Tax=Streptomyces sp. NPDC052052 TaxID=3154756 RepID=UPI003414BAED